MQVRCLIHCLIAAGLLNSAPAVAQTTYYLGGPDGSLTPNASAWAWDGVFFEGLRAALEDGANFGPGGTVPVQVRTQEVFSTASLVDHKVDGFVVPYWNDGDISASQIDDILTAFMNGMDLILFQDDNSHDAVGDRLLLGALNSAGGEVNGLAPFFEGAFGTATDVETFGAIGQTNLALVQSTGGHVVATNSADEVIACYWNRGEHWPRSGALMLISDVDIMTSQATYAPLDNNGVFGLNVMDYVVQRESVARVGGPSLGLTINSFWDHPVFADFRMALESPAVFGQDGLVKTRIITVDLDRLLPVDLQQLSVFVMPFWLDSSASPHLSAIAKFHQDGRGEVLMMNDDSSHDAYADSVGLGTINSVSSFPSTGRAPAYQGPFGTVSWINHDGFMGTLDGAEVIARKGGIVGTFGTGEISMAVWDEGRFGWRSGRTVITTDACSFAEEANYGVMNQNAIHALNTMAYLLTDNTYWISGPDHLIAPSSGSWTWEGPVLADFRAALDDPDRFGATGTVPVRIRTVDTGAISPSSMGFLDGFVSPFWRDTETQNPQTIVDQARRGLDLLLMQDTTSHDTIGTMLGVPTTGPASGFLSTGTSDLFVGPFGTATTIHHAGGIGRLTATSDVPEAAQNDVGESSALYHANDEEHRLHGGSLVVLGDTCVVGSPAADYGTMNDNAKFGLNLVAALATDDCGDGVEPYGFGCPGSANQIPTLSMDGCAVVGERMVLQVDHALGGALSYVFLGFTGRDSVNLRGCDFLLAGPLYRVALLLAGSGPGAGNLTIPYDINDPAFAGVQMNVQVIIRDTGAARGLSTTNGLEIVMGF